MIMTMEKELQKKYMQLQMLEQQSRQVEQHIEQIEVQAVELTQVRENLEEIRGVKEGTSMLVPMVGGVFLRANVASTDGVLVNVGSGIVVKKSLDAAIGMIDAQIIEASEVREQMAGKFQQITATAARLQQELRAIAKKA